MEFSLGSDSVPTLISPLGLTFSFLLGVIQEIFPLLRSCYCADLAKALC